jgi:SAM-dependent methyltransferase
MATLRGANKAGDADYGRIGAGYASMRRPEPFIAQVIDKQLGSAKTVLNVGAGAGSYEPRDRDVVAVEPSATMRAQRPPELVEAINAVAESLPFADDRFDASMATFTVHQWPDLLAGLTEMRRVTRGPVLVLSCDPSLVQRFWLNDYCAKVLAIEASRYPPLGTVADALGGTVEVVAVPIPLKCTDGFNEAYYGRPEQLLRPEARRACSGWSFVDESETRRFSSALEGDLSSGRWDAQYGSLRTQPFLEGSLRLIIGH